MKKLGITPLFLLALTACNPENIPDDKLGKEVDEATDKVAVELPDETLGKDIDSALNVIATTIEAVPEQMADSLKSQLNQIYSDQEVVRLRAHSQAAGCFTTANSEIPTNPDLVIYINADKGYAGLQKVANCFAEDTGYHIAVQTPKELPTTFENNPSAVDIIIWAHDRFGSWAEDGLLEPISLPVDVLKSMPEDLFRSVTAYNKQYGYPLALEGPVLLTNSALLLEPVTQIEQIASLVLDSGVSPLAWDYNNSYFTRGFLLSGDGYEFALSESGWNTADPNVNDPSAIAALDTLKVLIDNNHIIAIPDPSDGKGYKGMDDAFKNGEVAMIINGPWSFYDYSKAGIDFTVSKYPSINGQTSEPYLGVLSAGISAHSAHKDVAKVFIEQYLLTEEGLATIDSDRSLGVPANIGLLVNKALENEFLAEFAVAMSDSIPMPNVPEMSAFWLNMGPALTSVFNGSTTSTSALNSAQSQLTAD